jgi:hypothetical protein
MLAALANAIAGWQLFGQHDGAVPGILVLVGIVLMQLLPKAKRIESDMFDESH